MKHIHCLVLLLLIFFDLKAQPATEPFKEANTILIETGMPAEEVFIKWGRHLAQNGYAIQKSYDQFYSLTTGSKFASKNNNEFFLISSITDSGTITVNVRWTDNLEECPRYYEWAYESAKHTAQNVIYHDVKRLISAFGQYDIYYEKR